MIDHLITPEQVRTHRYGVWACDTKGQAYVHGLCAAEVCDVPYWPVSQQCTRFADAGPELLYCKVHARRFVCERT